MTFTQSGRARTLTPYLHHQLRDDVLSAAYDHESPLAEQRPLVLHGAEGALGASSRPWPDLSGPFPDSGPAAAAATGRHQPPPGDQLAPWVGTGWEQERRR